MWMMGYSEGGGGDINTIQDPFTGRKLRPLIPRPAAAATTPCLTRFHGTDLFALNHHLAMAEQSKRDLNLNTQQVVVSSRWNPTPEQLQTLEELYRRGTRTPSAEQIQHITSQLRRYGKIEGKNVFYWFQNHKARERQKRRRQLESFPDRDEHLQPHTHHDNNADSREGANRTLFEVEQTKNWASPTNSSTPPQKSGEAEAECKADDGWVQFDDDAELQRRRNATWQMMNLSCSSPSPSPTTPIPAPSPSSPTVALPAVATMQFTPQDFINILLEPYSNSRRSSTAVSGDAEAQTLQLFPLQSGRRRPERSRDHNEDEYEDEDDDEEEDSRVSLNNHVTPYQFFEFLPLKN